jgi:hypothetical protein
MCISKISQTKLFKEITLLLTVYQKVNKLKLSRSKSNYFLVQTIRIFKRSFFQNQRIILTFFPIFM